MDKIKRYAPLVGTAILASAALLQAFGQSEAADLVKKLGGGFIGESTVGGEAIVAAIAAAAGVFLKVKSEAKKAANQ